MKATKVNSVDRDFTGVMEFLASHQLFLQGEEEGRRASFMHIDFSGFDFSNFNLSRAMFKNCNLTKAIFSQELLEEIIFDGCNLSESSFLCKEIKNSSFLNCTANSIFLSNLSFEACNFNNFSSNSGVFTKNGFYKCNFEKTTYQDANFNSSQFQECRLHDVNFVICDFAYSNMIKSNFQKVDFLGSDLFSCNFYHSIFKEGRFKSAVFNAGSNIIKTSLKSVKFQDCKLQKCFFEERQEDLAKLIIKTRHKEKQDKVLKMHLTAFFASKALILASTISFFILITIPHFKFDKVTYSINVIILAGLLTIKEASFKKIHFTNLALLKSKAFTVLPAFLSFLTFFTIWFQSLKYEDFTFSLSILLLFSVGAFYSYSYLLSVKSFLNSSYNKNK